MNITIYHNPKCSKSRKTLEIIESHDISPSIVKYLQEPPSAGELLRIANLVGVPLSELLRRGEDDFQNAYDKPPIDNDEKLARWLQKNPSVLERPIVVDEDRGRAIVGRPPENVLSLLKA